MRLTINAELPRSPFLRGFQLLNYPRGLEIMRLTGSESPIDRNSAVPVRAWIGLVLALCVGAATLGASVSASAEVCTGPRELEARLRSAPSPDAYALLGNWFSKNGQVSCAVDTLQSGLVSYPNADALTAGLVSLYVNESHFEAASALSRKLAQEKPHDIEAQRIYLRTLVNTGSYDEAALLGRKLLALAPHDADLLNLNGFLERKAGNYPAARKHLEEAVAVNPNDYNPRVNLGLVLEQLGDAAGASLQLEKALELGADAPQIHFELAKALRVLGKIDDAQRQLQLYQKRLKEESDRSLAVLKSTEAAQAAKAGDNRKAADLYREACAAEPGNAGFAYRLAMVLDDLGDAAAERTALEQAIKADPNLVVAQYQLGYLDFQVGDNTGAERQFRLTVQAAPDNAQAWVSLAAVLGAESKSPEALDAVATALKLEPDNAAARALSNKLAATQVQH
jgi:tetratricopeptide (TPR) repeat protein